MKKSIKLSFILCFSFFLLQEKTMNAQTDTAFFKYAGPIAQTWLVPCGVTSVTIAAFGAQGGSSNNNGAPGGLGAEMVGTFTVTPAQVLTVVVGEQGRTSGNRPGSGGGGGSGVESSGTPLIIAGAGGGRNNGGYANADATTANNGQNGSGNSNGGVAGGDGGDVVYVVGVDSAMGGRGFNSGNTGSMGRNGEGSGNDTTNGVWGLGGGGGGVGSGNCNCGGGGGGYSGGGAGGINADGGGGGSYNNGTSQTNTASVRSGNGLVYIIYTGPLPLKDSAGVVSEVLCNSSNSGSASATASGGTGPYTYAWTPVGGTNANITGLTAGTYTSTVTDASGCSTTASVTITQPTAVAVTDSIVNLPCNGTAKGKVFAMVSGGTGSYTYNWSGGLGTNSSITGLTAGSYTVTVTDANGCIATATPIVTQPAALSIAFDSALMSPCHDSLWAIVGGGTTAYSFMWSPGGATSDTLINLCNGNYKVVVTDHNGCKDSASINLVPLDVTTIENANSIHIYPVPASGILNIDVANNTFGLSDILVFDVTGRKVMEEKTGIHASHTIINVSKLDNGTYFLRINGANGSSNFKFEINK